MKKLLYLPLIALALMIASCSEKTPAQKAIDAMDSAIEALKHTDNPEKAEAILTKFGNEMESIKDVDYKPTPEEEQELADKSTELFTLIMGLGQ